MSGDYGAQFSETFPGSFAEKRRKTDGRGHRKPKGGLTMLEGDIGEVWSPAVWRGAKDVRVRSIKLSTLHGVVAFGHRTIIDPSAPRILKCLIFNTGTGTRWETGGQKRDLFDCLNVPKRICVPLYGKHDSIH